MTRKPLTSDESGQPGFRPEKIIPQSLVDLEPGGAGNLPTNFRRAAGRTFITTPSPSCAKSPITNCACGCRTPNLPRRVRQVLHDFEAYMADKDTWGQQNAPAAAQESRRLFLGRIRFPRNAAHRRRRPGHPGRRPRQIRQRPRTSALSASACFIGKAISSRPSTRTTGRRNITPCSTRKTCRWNRCSTPRASRWSARWKST